MAKSVGVSVVLSLIALSAMAHAQTTAIYSYTVPANGYAPNGNLSAYTDSVMGTWAMQYDGLNRLQNAAASAGAFQGVHLQWQFDSFGNRLNQTRSGTSNASLPPAWSTTYNANNQMITSSTGLTPTYDGAGNMTFDGAATYVAYDGENRVCATLSTIGAAGITQYLYNAEGQRVAKGHPINNPGNTLFCPTDRSNFAATATYVLGPGGEQMTEIDGSGNWQHTNVYNGGQLLATYDTQGLHFPQADPLGTVRVQASAIGAEEQHCTSLPFGDGLSCTGIPDPTEHHFTGKERDTESGLDYFGARYYGSSMGRFTSPDDGSDQTPSDPQSWNLYSYVRNNPLKNTDPTGNACVGGVDDDRGGESCAQVDAADAEYARQGKAAVTVTATPGNSAGSFLLNSLFALNNVANNYFAALTGLRATSNLSLGNDWTGRGANIAMQGALFFVGPEGEAGGAINITEKGLAHIAQRHMVAGAKAAGKSVFNAGTDVKALVQAAGSTPVTTNAVGNLERVVQASTTVGTDRATGAATSVYTVVTKPNGDLVTAFPGRP